MGHNVWSWHHVDERVWCVSDPGVHFHCTTADMVVKSLFRGQVQRYLSLRTVGEAKKACLLTMITMASLIIMVSKSLPLMGNIDL